jgi:hypothetical protein
VQVPKPGGPLEVVEREVPEPALHKSASGFRPVAYAVVTPLPERGCFRAYSTRGFQATKLQALLM